MKLLDSFLWLFIYLFLIYYQIQENAQKKLFLNKSYD